ncbi:hypothetical protein U2F26_26790 [Micromonospora sp. 4G57]|uniref:Exo-alpha-sialidase n=1 Tax=Micromonospora sicca TaxID=2202420 RepID=A0ABU5JJZ2_9ACTN|nr:MULTISPECIES: hypothetical protein [unclassified Micromonospora]MDZ5446298.1 hypothetical protein [Micromonospora sp. 4G57]MDZ5492952.1 hypothetical protein [Micromonospora sp. 4G53]
MVVARSAGRGASWTTWRPEVRTNVVAAVGVDDREAYLLIEPPPPAGSMAPTGVATLLRTRDGGRTWADTGTDLRASQENPQITLGSDGSLLVARTGSSSPDLIPELLVSQDGGRHFGTVRKDRQLEGAAGVAPGRAWFFERDDLSDPAADHVLITSHGLDWIRFSLPR